MATSFTLKHDFPGIELDLFEEHLNHPELVKELGAMPGMKSRELISEKKAGNGDTLWQFKVVVDSKLPRAMEKIVSQEMMSWQESSRFSRPEHCIYWEMEPFMGKTKFQSSGTWELSEYDEGTRRIINGEVSIKVPFVGKAIEAFMVSEIKKSYEVEPTIQLEFYQRKQEG